MTAPRITSMDACGPRLAGLVPDGVASTTSSRPPTGRDPTRVSTLANAISSNAAVHAAAPVI